MSDYEAAAIRAVEAGDLETLSYMAFGSPTGCACLGARGGEPVCPCRMRAAAVKRLVLPIALRDGRIVRAATKE